MVSRSTRRTTLRALAGCGLVAALFGAAVSPASAAGPTDGPLDLGAAAGYGVLAATAVTNTGSSSVTGDLGIWPDTAISGFGGSPSPMITGTVHTADAAANQAQNDTTTAYNAAESLTPTATGFNQLTGQTLAPGVYAGGAVSLADNSVLTLIGSKTSVWVFQASSSLTIGAGTQVSISGGASACNVFWQVGTSATIGADAQFQGTILADTSITATSKATITGRLLARTGAVTLDTDTIITPSGCPSPLPAGTAPAITSGTPLAATVGTPYAHLVTASGTPAPTFTLSAGALPAGLVLNKTSGLISGIPTVAGPSTFSISASNGTTQNATVSYTLTAAAVTPVLPDPSTPPGDPAPPLTPVPPTPLSPDAALPDPPAGSPSFGAAQHGAGTALAHTGPDATPIGVAGGLTLLVGIGLFGAAGIRRRRELSRSRVRA